MPRRKYAKGTKQNPIRIRTSRAEKRMYKSQRKSRSYKPRVGITGVTTFQKDVKTAYRFKRAPTRVRRKAKRSYRSFISNLLRSEGSRKFQYAGTNIWATTQNNQGMFGWFNYGANGVGGMDGSADIGDVFLRMDREFRVNGTSSDQAEGGGLARRLYLDSMQSKITFTNTGATSCFWEIYECYARKDIPLSEANTLKVFLTQMQNGAFQASLQNTGSTAPGAPNTPSAIIGTALPTYLSNGMTPFQFRHFCQNFKIVKVTRLQAEAGRAVSFDSRSPKNVTVNFDDYNLLLAKRGVTKLTLVRQWGQMENYGGSPQPSPSECAVELDKTYNAKVLDTKLPQLNYQRYGNSVPLPV